MSISRLILLGLAFAVSGADAQLVLGGTPVTFGIDIFFARDSAVLPSDAQARIESQMLQGHKTPDTSCLAVVGYADEPEANSMNAQQLGLSRAQVVADVFRSLGYPVAHIQVESRGVSNLVAQPPSSSNARVEVEVYRC